MRTADVGACSAGSRSASAGSPAWSATWCCAGRCSRAGRRAGYCSGAGSCRSSAAAGRDRQGSADGTGADGWSGGSARSAAGTHAYAAGTCDWCDVGFGYGAACPLLQPLSRDYAISAGSVCSGIAHRVRRARINPFISYRNSFLHDYRVANIDSLEVPFGVFGT